MMSKIPFLSLFLVLSFNHLISHEVHSSSRMNEEVLGSNFHNGIIRQSNNFYTAKIKDKDLWLAMERIDDNTQPRWLSYAQAQSDPSVLRITSDLTTRSTGSGAHYFLRVLEGTDHTLNEIWVAYITKQTPEPIPSEMGSYSHKRVLSPPAFAKNIEMFLTVTSSPQALLTTHLGIEASFESIYFQTRTKGISLDLHSFAAKVMLGLNPERRFMVNAPAFTMEQIL